MAAATLTAYHHQPVPFFELHTAADSATHSPLGALTSSYDHLVHTRHAEDIFLSPLSGPATSSARPSVPKPRTQTLSSNDAPMVHDYGASNGTDALSADNTVAPPVPPKHDTHNRPLSVRTVSIVAPTDISPVRRVFSHSASDTGHYYRTSSNFSAGSSESAPAPPNPLTSQHPAAHIRISVTDCPPFSSATLRARPSGMDPVIATRKTSSIPVRRNRLQKPRPSPLIPSFPANPSTLDLLLSRMFGSGDSYPRHRKLSTSTSTSDRSYRPTRSLSDGSAKTSLTRPPPSSWGSDTADSSCTASSSASTPFSYASTALTTPDSTSPALSPRSSTSGNRLQKKRPILAPSAYQYPLGTHSAVLGRSKSTPNGLGQRTPRNRIWSSVEEARFAAEEAHAYGGSEPSWWNSPPVEPSPSRRSTLGPILEVRKRTSSQTLADLAWTGLSSTSVYNVHSAEDSRHKQVWDNVEPFNPYAECTSPDVNAHSAPLSNNDSQSLTPSDSPQMTSKNDVSNDIDSPSSGFAIVNGYLDRSEDAMRRWTLSMADVPEEALVHHLERLRRESAALARGRLPGRRSAAPSQVGHGDDGDVKDRRSSFFFGGPREMGISPRSSSHAYFSVGHDDREDDGDESDEEALSDEDDEQDWKTARQVLFCCRELVQTERNYQTRLRELASTELSSHYALLVARYIPSLLRVSETLLAHVLDDPSAWGVSAAFIGCEEDLEAAFVAWSGVAGEFFVEDANLRPPKKLTKKLADETFSTLGHDASTSSLGRVMRTRSHAGIASSNRGSRRFSSTMSDIGHSDTSSTVGHGTGMFTAALGTGLAFGLAVSGPPSLESELPASAKSLKQKSNGLGRVPTSSSGIGLTRAITAWKRMSMPSSLTHIPSFAGSAPGSMTQTVSPSQSGVHGNGKLQHRGTSSHGHLPVKKPSERDKMTARDLAIQPTQRVMRYVLQYRDLLDHTPTTSPSRALVERAHDSALRIAKRCDRAQAHAAFIRQTTNTNKSDKHLSRHSTTL